MGINRRRYRAFISYSQADFRQAQRLHRALESYRVPQGVQCEVIDPQTRRLGRFFRDTEEMAAATDISATVRGALEDSESLIVVCSPRSARSRWVNEEVEHFRNTGRHDRVYAVIIDGEPNSGDPETECFPALLRVDAAAGADPEQMPLEPVGIDIRKESLERVCARIAAAIVGAPFDDLWRRDRRQARERRLAQLGVAAALALVAAVTAGEAATQNWRARWSAVADSYIFEGAAVGALPFAVAGLPPPGALLTSRGPHADDTLADVGATPIRVETAPIAQWALAADGKTFLALDEDDHVTLYDVARGARASRGALKDVGELDMGGLSVSGDGRFLLTQLARDHRTLLYDLSRGVERPVALGDLLEPEFSADGRTMAAWTMNGRAWLYDLTGAHVRRTSLGALRPPGWRYGAKGKALFTQALNGAGTFYDLARRTRTSLGMVGYAAFSVDGGSLVTRAKDPDPIWTIYDLRRGDVPTVLGNLGEVKFPGRLSADGKTLAIWRVDHTGALVRRGSRGGIVELGDLGDLKDLVLSADGGMLFTWRKDGRAALRDFTRGGAPIDLGVVSTYQVSTGLGALVTVDPHSDGAFYDLSHHGARAPLGRVAQQFLTFSPDGRWLVSMYQDGTATLYDVAKSGHSTDLGKVESVHIAGDGETLVTQNIDTQHAILYDLASTVWAGARRPSGAALSSAVCGASGDAMRTFPHLLRDSVMEFRGRASKTYYEEFNQELRGRPWNPCDWRGLGAIFPSKARGEDWFEGPLQWLRLVQIRYFGGRDFVCGEMNARGQHNARREESCRLDNPALGKS